MGNTKLKNYLHLHFIVFVWGFTAVLGKLISVGALSLVWFRMSIAVVLTLIYIGFKKYSLRVPARTFRLLLVGGLVITLHWLTFFKAIKVSNVSVALATMSTGAFFTAILEPIWYRRKFKGYEIIFGLIVIFGLYVMLYVETLFIEGIVLALISALLSAIFTLINGKLIQSERPSAISFYELGSGVVFLSIYLGVMEKFNSDFFRLSQNDWLFLVILASVCTAYAFIASVKVMKYISPYTVMLTINLEPVYGILLAYFILGDSEKMKPMFYVGTVIILTTVIANGILKTKRKFVELDAERES
ncbi:DMT family transporter [Flavobacteriaceae bacterium F89]|uniref:DMT family transporter n=1 Tax=Cerina litoralis TaxID=2874477 RepID=A0AAE3EQT9_9FLAO|nr:DMT family transporter [Cerina litoralis]MCG2459440.1 DMT family transporter [Cerina litoralis]